MTPQEFEFENRKHQLRQEASDKEVQRLRKVNRNQSHKITKLRKAMYFQMFFFVSLFLVFLLRGIIVFTGSSSNEDFKAYQLKYDDLQKVNSILEDSLKVYTSKLQSVVNQNLVERDENGLRFRVQIGAFKEINLRNYTTNLVAINQETYDSINQYTIGVFKDYQKARVFLEDIKKMGFNDSFIISTKNGRRIPIEKLTEEELYPNGKDSVSLKPL
ncbi:SPOR domain-containing protein [Plebeiibacterium sediminum]|uniref:SPOR domain-containing protein n=1 Tax=Plebeiibacterium sediminum TaxID=2992112 RepID=A0AAE3M1G3_9BACT|nr:SPOR domain-containing protein [Plebeiobacterium sediminum]MCW3784959.1 SPOR domain-containing protein [Plebeiobacterium sediminum]